MLFPNNNNDSEFPPALKVGNRVWTVAGYEDHGPDEGPRVNVPPNQGGTIKSIQKPFQTYEQLLYQVTWDNGQETIHYASGLFSIGKFTNRAEFEAAIRPIGTVQLALGPLGGFKKVQIELDYNGKRQKIELFDKRLWSNFLESLARKAGCQIVESRAPKNKNR